MNFPTRTVKIGDALFGGGKPLALIAGPCVIESLEVLMEAAERLCEMCQRFGVPLVFKSLTTRPIEALTSRIGDPE